jgi:hypothetical protein
MSTQHLLTPLILILIIMNILSSCLDSIREKNRRLYTPDYCFEPEKLPMAVAIYKGDTREVERIVKEQKIDINAMSSKSGFRYLFYACLMEDVGMVKKLLSLGADPNKISINKTGKKRGIKETNLSFVVGRGNLKLTKLLLENGATPNTPVGLLPLNVAMSHKNMQEYLDLLFKYGADANYKEYGSCENAAQIALIVRHYKMIHYFLDKGSDPTSVDRSGWSLAYSVQDALADFRGTEKARKELESVKARLIKEYHIHFPVTEQTKKGMANEIARYQELPLEIRELPGMEDDKYYTQRVQDSLSAGKTITGQPLKN